MLGTIDLAPVAAACLAALMIMLAWDSRRRYLRLPQLPLKAGATREDHVVIIPARNEETRIQRVVESLGWSTVLVVDDDSTDATAARAQAAGAHVRKAQALQTGWKGKPNACWTGTLYTESKWILFVDADTWFDPPFITSLLEYAAGEGIEGVTVFPKQEMGSPFETILLPYAFGLYFAGVNPGAVNDPRRPEALANGQCLLVRRDAYQFIQGHRAVSDSVIEDVALAKLFKRHRMTLRVMRAEHMAHVRMYDSLDSIWKGFEKNSFRFLQANPATGVRVILTAIVMTTWLPLLLWLLFTGHFVAAGAFFFAAPVAWWPWYGSITGALSAPIAIYLFQMIALSSMAKRMAGVSTEWKGRRV